MVRQRAARQSWGLSARRRITERSHNRIARRIAAHIELLFSMSRRNPWGPEFFLDGGSAGPVRWCPRFRCVELRFSYGRVSVVEQNALRSSCGIVCIFCDGLYRPAVSTPLLLG